MRLSAFITLGAVLILSGCGDDDDATGETAGTTDTDNTGETGDDTAPAWDWAARGVPQGVPPPTVPADNPQSLAKIELGRHLFYDRRLSENQTQSCATCHKQALAFTDGRATAVGSTGAVHPRNSMALANAAYVPLLTWANPNLVALEQQALIPLFGENPVELGFSGREDVLLARLNGDADYPARFAAAFGDETIDLDRIAKAIAAFERDIVSFRSPYDRHVYGGDKTALSASAKRGMELFFGERMECFHCHGGLNFSDSIVHANTPEPETAFHNTGLYNLTFEIAGVGVVGSNYVAGNQGLYEVTQKLTDRGRFRAPTLRNVAVTAPYMHDGSIATLEGVLDHYAAGGRTIAEGPYAGVGSQNAYKSIFVQGFSLDAQERADMVEFLKSLTDEDLLRDPRYAEP